MICNICEQDKPTTPVQIATDKDINLCQDCASVALKMLAAVREAVKCKD